jgi:16S rRNA G966 N2-methylase RsmD
VKGEPRDAPSPSQLVLVDDPEATTSPSAQRPFSAEITGHKGSIYYRAHSYHTKVPPEGITKVLAHYTSPGDTVLDPFCGSGMTGLGAMLTGRRALLSDLSPAAVHIANGYTTRVDHEVFRRAGSTLLEGLQNLQDALYRSPCDCGSLARVEYTVWSDVFGCSNCGSELLFWRDGLSADRKNVLKTILCTACSAEWRKRDLEWRGARPVWVSLSCDRCGRIERAVGEEERAYLLAADRSAIEAWYPTRAFESHRQMWRGQHRVQGIETAAEFFTPRNLRGLAELWRSIGEIQDDALRSALRFTFTSIVNRASKRYQWNAKRPTNVLSSTMYIASLSYEFNVFSLLRRKLKTVADLYAATADLPGEAEVSLAPAQDLNLIPSRSIDYVFTDPPFGSNIFYSDASFLWESWLDEFTDVTYESVVHTTVTEEHGGKTVEAYEKLMTGAFEEMSRVLRPEAWASVMFHNSDDAVWSALERAIEGAGLSVEGAVVFDKSQPSFKAIKGQLLGEAVPSFDLVLHLRNGKRTSARSTEEHRPEDVRQMLSDRLRLHLKSAPARKRTTPYVHSLVMRALLEEGVPLKGFSYQFVESLCRDLFVWADGTWELNTEDARS